MKNIKSKKAFTMIELVFVIVIIGILAAVAVPRLAATRDDAEIVKARTVVASVRNALAMERQKRILRGNFDAIVTVGGSNTGVFGNFDDIVYTAVDNKAVPVLESSVSSSTSSGHWSVSGSGTDTKYVFHQNSLGDVEFIIANTGQFKGKFVCVTDNDACKTLTN